MDEFSKFEDRHPELFIMIYRIIGAILFIATIFWAEISSATVSLLPSGETYCEVKMSDGSVGTYRRVFTGEIYKNERQQEVSRLHSIRSFNGSTYVAFEMHAVRTSTGFQPITYNLIVYGNPSARYLYILQQEKGAWLLFDAQGSKGEVHSPPDEIRRLTYLAGLAHASANGIPSNEFYRCNAEGKEK